MVNLLVCWQSRQYSDYWLVYGPLLKASDRELLSSRDKAQAPIFGLVEPLIRFWFLRIQAPVIYLSSSGKLSRQSVEDSSREGNSKLPNKLSVGKMTQTGAGACIRSRSRAGRARWWERQMPQMSRRGTFLAKPKVIQTQLIWDRD